MKYLIIDDNPEMRKIISQTVCSAEDDFMECSDGKDAIDAYLRFLPDFVLMDIKMNTMNGIEATKRILKNFPDARVIIITDYNTHVFRNAAIKAGALTLLSKENLSVITNFIKKYNNTINTKLKGKV
jgi:DNA-binding NarL/FixJ family response regulator